MKTFKTTKSVLYSLAILVAVVSACKNSSNPAPSKNNDTTKTTPPTDTTTTPVGTTGCKLTQEYYRGSSNIPLIHKFEYDANGNPSKITTYNNGVLDLTETVQPNAMEYREGNSTALYMGLKYDASYLLQPTNVYLSTSSANNWIMYVFTYDSQKRLSTVKGGYTDNGVYVDSTATTATFFYDANSDVSKITYTYRNKVVKTYTAKGYDTHPTPYHNIKNSWFLQHDFNVFATDYDAMRYMFERQSAHNLLGFDYIQTDQSYKYTETYKYVYDDKGQPIERQAAQSSDDQPATGGYVESWTYECN